MNWNVILTVDTAGFEYGKRLKDFILNIDKWYARYYVLYYLSRLCGITELEPHLLDLVKKMRKFEQDEAMLVIAEDITWYLGDIALARDLEDNIIEMIDNWGCLDLIELTERAYKYIQTSIPYKNLLLQKMVFLSVMRIANDWDLLSEITGYEWVYERGVEMCIESKDLISAKLGRDFVYFFLLPMDIAGLLGVLGLDIFSWKNLSLFRRVTSQVRGDPRAIFTEKIIDFLEMHRNVSDIVFVEHFLELTHRGGLPIIVRFCNGELYGKLMNLCEKADKGDISWIWEKYKESILEYYPEVWMYRGLLERY